MDSYNNTENSSESSSNEDEKNRGIQHCQHDPNNTAEGLESAPANRRKQRFINSDEPDTVTNICVDDGCETMIDNGDILDCDLPSYDLKVCLYSIMLIIDLLLWLSSTI
jgi:hypothetical protein